MKTSAQLSRVVVMELAGLHWATQKNTVEAELSRRPGVLHVDANIAAHSASVTFDTSVTSVESLATWIRECGFHCRGESVPEHLCVSLAPGDVSQSRAAEHPLHGSHAGRDMGPTLPVGERQGTPAR